MVCEADHVELSLTAFKQLEKPDAGRATGATVNIVECGGSPPKTSLAGHTPATSTPADDASLVGKSKEYPPPLYPSVAMRA